MFHCFHSRRAAYFKRDFHSAAEGFQQVSMLCGATYLSFSCLFSPSYISCLFSRRDTGTAFDNRIYSIKVTCGQDYPDVAPKIRFQTAVSMDGVDKYGELGRHFVILSCSF